MDMNAARIDIFSEKESVASQRVIPMDIILTTISNSTKDWNDIEITIGIPCLKCGAFVSAQSAIDARKNATKTVVCLSLHRNDVPQLLEDDGVIKQVNQFVKFSDIKIENLLGQGNLQACPIEYSF